MREIYSFKERDSLLSKLSEEQQGYIKEYVAQRKKSRFANIMAKYKGQVLPEDASDIEIEEILDGWILEDYIDNGKVSNETPCECGRPLRYQYIVKHTKTHEFKRLGINHFEEHTNFSSELIKMIRKGLTEIDYELDELLYKLQMNWKNEDHLREFPKSIPNEIKKQLKMNLPLLDRHVSRLNSILDQERKQEFIQNRTVKKEEQTSLFVEEPEKNEKRPDELSEEQKEIILNYLKNGISDSLYLTEIMIENHGAYDARYDYTNRPKLYPLLVNFLSDKARNGILIEEQKEKGIRHFWFKDNS